MLTLVLVLALPCTRLEASWFQPTADEDALKVIQDRALSHHARINNLKATIRSRHQNERGWPVSCVVAAKGPARFESLWHGKLSERDHDPAGLTRFYDGVFFNMFHHYERRYEITKRFAAQPYLSKIQGHFLFECLGWWPPDDSSPPPRRQGEPEFLVEILNDPRLELRSEPETIDGCLCLIIEIPAVVRLWIDAQLGVVRRREQLGSAEHGEEETLALYLFSDFSPYEPDIWLPRRIERQFPTSNTSTVHIIDAYQVNTVNDATFAFEPPPGSLIYDRDSDTYRQVPGGLDGLGIVAQRIINEVAGDEVTPDRTGAVLWNGFAWFLFGLCACKLFSVFQGLQNRPRCLLMVAVVPGRSCGLGETAGGT